jgi:GAF domain-containing protein
MGYTIVAGEPVISDDATADDRFAISALLSENEPVSAAAVTIAGQDEPFGALGALSKQRRSFSRDDLNFLQGVANVVSTAVAREGSKERLVQVRESERRRIARDLHDEALQRLTDALARRLVQAQVWLARRRRDGWPGWRRCFSGRASSCAARSTICGWEARRTGPSQSSSRRSSK